MRAVRLSLALLLAAAAALPAQTRRADPAPGRPRLPVGDDTCDASHYYRFGLAQLRENPARAADAFYWTQRLSPNMALAYYAQRVALLTADPDLLRRYVDGDRRTLRSAKVRRIDSLQVRANLLDPFFPPVLEEALLITWATRVVTTAMRSSTWETPHVSDDEVEAYVRRELEAGDETVQAWLAYARTGYRRAAAYWAVELRRHPDDLELRERRARALYLAGLPDSAAAELGLALAAARRSDAQTMRFVYASKELWEYEMGRIHEQRNDLAAARDAYQRALVEDLSFHPAHVRLAYVAIRTADTASAVTELERAIAIKEDDYGARLALGIVQAARGAYGPATEHLRRATEIEPWAAQPHFVLADVRQKAGDAAGAAAEYARFIDLAARSDPSVPIARQRLTALAPPAP